MNAIFLTDTDKRDTLSFKRHVKLMPKIM